ncbi:MAG: aspartate aminotransferase family protein [Trueperaceae bacterium]|jgi:4-aminobutyrate aminotransferase|nr:aspartate aminotransferase family protein [Trueperaceae bacterium]
MSNKELQARRQAAVTRAAQSVHPIYPVRGEGSYVWDADGKKYLDFSAGIAVMNLGHSHPKVLAAVKRSVDEFQHLCFAVGMHPSYIELAERLNAIAPGPTPKKTFLVNSGAEAVENTVKIARAYTKRAGIVAFTHAFHGRTYMAMSLTNKANPYKTGFVMRAAEVYRAEYPYHFRNPWGAKTPEETGEAALKALKNQVKYTIGESEVAAFLIEPEAGEGGFIPAPRNFLAGLRKYADEIGALWIDDEVQTGIGRTGKTWAVDHYGLEPDLIASAKGLGSGFPIAAVVGKAHIMDSLNPGMLGTTFGGNPTSCAAALATLDVMAQENIPEKAARLGEVARARLDALKERYAAIGEVRGLGIMLGIEFVGEDGITPDPKTVDALLVEARNQGLILLSTGTYGNVIRLLPPLTMTEDELLAGLEIVEDALAKVLQDKAVVA